MGMQDYPVQGVGICVNDLDWKDSSYIDELIEQACDGFYMEVQPNNETAYIDIVSTEEWVFLIIYNYKAYQRTPFNSFEELQQCFIRALRDKVNNTDAEIIGLIDDINTTYWG